MFSRSFLVAFCLVLLESLLAEEESKHCYDWEKDNKEIKGFCHECKQKPNRLELEICLNEKLETVDEEGNAVPSKIRDHYLVGLDESKVDAMKDAMKDCGKDTEPLKINGENLKTVDEIWECADLAMMKVCPEAKEQRDLYEDDEDMKDCLPEHF